MIKNIRIETNERINNIEFVNNTIELIHLSGIWEIKFL